MTMSYWISNGMKKTFLLIIFFASLVGVASAATAGQLTYTPLEPFSAWDAKAGAYDDFAKYINTIFKLLITLGALFAVVMLVVAGIGYMVSEAAIDIQKAKDRAVAALWGLLLLTGCWLILYTINPNLLKFNLNIPTAPGGTYTSGPSAPGGGSTGVQQNLGDSTKFSSGNPYGFSTLSTIQQAALISDLPGGINCNNWVSCFAGTQYISFDPNNVDNPDVKKAIENYTSNCESFLGNYSLGNIRKVDGSFVGAPGQTGYVCQLIGTAK